MRLLVIAVVALVAAVVAAQLVASDPGFVVIGYGGKVIRTTFAFFVVVLLIVFLAVHGLANLATRIARSRTQWRQRAASRRRGRAHAGLNQGLMAMAAGDFTRAERLFRNAADADEEPAAAYLAAATAAQAAHAPARRDNYLALAAGAQPSARTTFQLKRAEWLVENGQLSEARPLVEKLASAARGNPQVLRLRMILAEAAHDHAALLELLPDLRRDHVVAPDDASVLERNAAAALLADESQALAALESRWRGLSRPLRAEPEVLAAYVRALCRHGEHERAEGIVRKHLERHWVSSLAALYGEIACEPPARQLRKLEAWAVTRGEDPGLRLARARQAIRAGQWALARTEVEALMRLSPSPLLLELRAEIAEAAGDESAAGADRRAGLELALGQAPRAMLSAPDA